MPSAANSCDVWRAMRSARRLYRLSLALGSLGVLAILVAGSVTVGRLDLSPGPIRRLLSDCHQLILPSLSLTDLAILASASFALIAIARGLASAISQIRATRQLLKRLERACTLELAGVPVRLLAGEGAQAFCAGLLRPRVYLTHRTLTLLTEGQLIAVVAHEAHHARRHDPVRLLLATALADGLFFLPALQRMRLRYTQLAELAADQAAVDAFGGPEQLAGALLRFEEYGGAGAVGIHPERVDQLLGTRPECGMPPSSLAAGVLTSVAMIVLALAAAAVSGGTAHSVVQLAAQSCMIVMIGGPILAIGGLSMIGRRAVTAIR